MNERKEKEDFSTLFYYFPFITDRKEDINQHRNSVNLSPVDCSISFIKSFSKNEKKFNPSLLNSTDQDLRRPQVEMLFTILIRDVDYLSCYIRIINQNYVHFVEEKFKL